MNLVIYNTKSKKYLHYAVNPCKFTKDPSCASLFKTKKVANYILTRVRKAHPKMKLEIKQLISFPFSIELTEKQLNVDIETGNELIETVRKIFKL